VAADSKADAGEKVLVVRFLSFLVVDLRRGGWYSSCGAVSSIADGGTVTMSVTECKNTKYIGITYLCPLRVPEIPSSATILVAVVYNVSHSYLVEEI
jgi:hypothetical protein